MRQRNTPEPGAILANGPGVHGTVLYFLFLKGIVYEGVMLWSRYGQGSSGRRHDVGRCVNMGDSIASRMSCPI